MMSAIRRPSWPHVVPAGIACGWLAVAAAGGAQLGRLQFDAAGAAAVGLAAWLTARVTAVPSELLTPYAVAVLVGSAAVAVVVSEAATRIDDIAPVTWLALALAAGGTVAAGRQQWAPALGLLAVAAATAGLPGAFWFVAAAAVVVAAIGHRGALVTVLPGAVVAVDAALGSGGVALTAVAAGLVASSSFGLAAVRQPPRVTARHLPALAVACALLFAPQTWSWTGIDSLEVDLLGRTARGVSVAVAAGALAVVLGWLTGQVAAPRPEAPPS